MKQLIGGIAGALVTGIAIFGWNGSTTRDDASFSMAETQRPLQLVSDHRGTPAPVMDGESAPAALTVAAAQLWPISTVIVGRSAREQGSKRCAIWLEERFFSPTP